MKNSIGKKKKPKNIEPATLVINRYGAGYLLTDRKGFKKANKNNPDSNFEKWRDTAMKDIQLI